MFDDVSTKLWEWSHPQVRVNFFWMLSKYAELILILKGHIKLRTHSLIEKHMIDIMVQK